MSNTNIGELAEKQNRYLDPKSNQALNDLGIVLINPEALVIQERERIISWTTAFENNLISKWEMRDGILHTNDSYESYQDKLLNEFYGDGGASGTAQLNNTSESDVYSQMECDEFYAELDKSLGI